MSNIASTLMYLAVESAQVKHPDDVSPWYTKAHVFLLENVGVGAVDSLRQCFYDAKQFNVCSVQPERLEAVMDKCRAFLTNMASDYTVAPPPVVNEDGAVVLTVDDAPKTRKKK